MKGKLTLVPTPIDDQSSLVPEAKSLLLEACDDPNSIFCVEEHKAGRRRWLHFGLPKQNIESFILYNEHTHKDENSRLINELLAGKNIYLMSDCGLPAFCDPGCSIINLCHEYKIKVTSTPFHNSVVLALALSGFNHKKFYFYGFLAMEKDQRQRELNQVAAHLGTLIVMDTPYRLNRLIKELAEVMPTRRAFIALDLNKKDEICMRGTLKFLHTNLEKMKKEFIVVIDERGNE